MRVVTRGFFFPFYSSANLSTIVCNEDKVPLLLEKAQLCKELKNLIKIGSSVTQEEDKKAKDMGLNLISMTNLEVSGGIYPEP